MAGRADQVWYSFKNDTTETIPPYGIIRITDAEDEDENEQHPRKGFFLLASKPNTTARATYAVNGYAAVPRGKLGQCTFDGPLILAVKKQDFSPIGDTTIANMLKVGSKDDNWLARAKAEGGRSDFVVIGQTAYMKTHNLVLAIPIWCV